MPEVELGSGVTGETCDWRLVRLGDGCNWGLVRLDREAGVMSQLCVRFDCG